MEESLPVTSSKDATLATTLNHSKQGNCCNANIFFKIRLDKRFTVVVEVASFVGNL